jgi:hypothetical protein
MEVAEIASYINEVIEKRIPTQAVCFVHPEVYDAYFIQNGFHLFAKIYGYDINLMVLSVDNVGVFKNNNLKISEIVIRELGNELHETV